MSEFLTKEEFNKLPKWAQNKLYRVDKELEEYKARSEIVAGERESNAYMIDYPKMIPLPISNIRFNVSGGYIEVELHKSKSLIIRANYGLSRHEFVVVPQSSNQIEVKLVKEDKS